MFLIYPSSYFCLFLFSFCNSSTFPAPTPASKPKPKTITTKISFIPTNSETKGKKMIIFPFHSSKLIGYHLWLRWHGLEWSPVLVSNIVVSLMLLRSGLGADRMAVCYILFLNLLFDVLNFNNISSFPYSYLFKSMPFVFNFCSLVVYMYTYLYCFPSNPGFNRK